MRGGDIDGAEPYDGIVCPGCFAILAEAAGIAKTWRLHAQDVSVELQTVTPSGRVWNNESWLFDDAALSPVQAGEATEGDPSSDVQP